ncbi:MAG: hypothetical protein H7Y04_11410 [Verrucomicrobia bacterium]|nr:hypothetical protein [Cytophagales bacterium]
MAKVIDPSGKESWVLTKAIKSLSSSVDLDKQILDFLGDAKNAAWKDLSAQEIKDFLENKQTNPTQAFKLLEDLLPKITVFTKEQKQNLLKDIAGTDGLFGAFFSKPDLAQAWKFVEISDRAEINRDLDILNSEDV